MRHPFGQLTMVVFQSTMIVYLIDHGRFLIDHDRFKQGTKAVFYEVTFQPLSEGLDKRY